MFVVIFEVQPKKERKDDYLSLAKYLKPKLEAIDGFIDNERFASKRTEGRVLSLSTWRDEKAVVRWRTQGEHHEVQEKGRFEIFEDYHLRVGEVTEDNQPPGLSVEQKRFDTTEVSAGKVATITEIVPVENSGLGAKPDLLPAHLALNTKADGLMDYEMYESIYTPGKLALLVSWRDANAAKSWVVPTQVDAIKALRHRHVRILRDYGMHDRREAPQYYPEVSPTREMASG